MSEACINEMESQYKLFKNKTYFQSCFLYGIFWIPVSFCYQVIRVDHFSLLMHIKVQKKWEFAWSREICWVKVHIWIMRKDDEFRFVMTKVTWHQIISRKNSQTSFQVTTLNIILLTMSNWFFKVFSTFLIHLRE